MQEEVIGLLKEAGAVLTDSHFVGTSGRHMSIYVNKDALLAHPLAASRIGELFAEKNKDVSVDVVSAPAMGAVILGQWTAYHLSRLLGKEILSVYTEKDAEENQIFKRGYDKLVAGKNVLVIEDVSSTGLSIGRAVEPVRKADGTVVQASVIVNRDPKSITSEKVGVPLSWLAELPAETYGEEECPLCKKGIPIDARVGHGKQYLASKHGK